MGPDNSTAHTVRGHTAKRGGELEPGTHKRRRKTDLQYRWATEEDPSVENWRALSAEWVAQNKVRGKGLTWVNSSSTT